MVQITTKTTIRKRREALVKALRSGEYRQGMGSLMVLNDEPEFRSFCCEGVGCDLAAVALDETWGIAKSVQRGRFMNNMSYAPVAVSAFYAFETQSPIGNRWIVRVPVLESSDSEEINHWDVIALAEENDKGEGFGHIADLIENYYLKGGSEAYEAWHTEKYGEKPWL